MASSSTSDDNSIAVRSTATTYKTFLGSTLALPHLEYLLLDDNENGKDGSSSSSSGSSSYVDADGQPILLSQSTSISETTAGGTPIQSPTSSTLSPQKGATPTSGSNPNETKTATVSKQSSLPPSTTKTTPPNESDQQHDQTSSHASHPWMDEMKTKWQETREQNQALKCQMEELQYKQKQSTPDAGTRRQTIGSNKKKSVSFSPATPTTPSTAASTFRKLLARRPATPGERLTASSPSTSSQIPSYRQQLMGSPATSIRSTTRVPSPVPVPTWRTPTTSSSNDSSPTKIPKWSASLADSPASSMWTPKMTTGTMATTPSPAVSTSSHASSPELMQVQERNQLLATKWQVQQEQSQRLQQELEERKQQYDVSSLHGNAATRSNRRMTMRASSPSSFSVSSPAAQVLEKTLVAGAVVMKKSPTTSSPKNQSLHQPQEHSSRSSWWSLPTSHSSSAAPSTMGEEISAGTTTKPKEHASIMIQTRMADENDDLTGGMVRKDQNHVMELTKMEDRYAQELAKVKEQHQHELADMEEQHQLELMKIDEQHQHDLVTGEERHQQESMRVEELHQSDLAKIQEQHHLKLQQVADESVIKARHVWEQQEQQQVEIRLRQERDEWQEGKEEEWQLQSAALKQTLHQQYERELQELKLQVQEGKLELEHMRSQHEDETVKWQMKLEEEEQQTITSMEGPSTTLLTASIVPSKDHLPSQTEKEALEEELYLSMEKSKKLEDKCARLEEKHYDELQFLHSQLSLGQETSSLLLHDNSDESISKVDLPDPDVSQAMGDCKESPILPTRAISRLTPGRNNSRNSSSSRQSGLAVFGIEDDGQDDESQESLDYSLPDEPQEPTSTSADLVRNIDSLIKEVDQDKIEHSFMFQQKLPNLEEEVDNPSDEEKEENTDALVNVSTSSSHVEQALNVMSKLTNIMRNRETTNAADVSVLEQLQLLSGLLQESDEQERSQAESSLLFGEEEKLTGHVSLLEAPNTSVVSTVVRDDLETSQTSQASHRTIQIWQTLVDELKHRIASVEFDRDEIIRITKVLLEDKESTHQSAMTATIATCERKAAEQLRDYENQAMFHINRLHDTLCPTCKGKMMSQDY